jgi:hypothetical protein
MDLQYSRGKDTGLTVRIIIKMNDDVIVVNPDKDKRNLKSTTLIEYWSRPNNESAI